jgi:hypothetical protein
MDARIANVHTALPAQVMAYNAGAQTVDVQPQVMRVVQDPDELDAHGNALELIESLPQIPGVPIAFPRSGDNWITFPITPGDTGLLIFAERSIDTWRANGRESDPGSLRMHNLSDAIYIPGVAPTSAALVTSATAMVLNAAEIDLGGVAPPSFVALATAVTNALQTLKDAISNAVPVPNDGGAALQASIVTALSAWPPSVAATKVKAL